MTNKRLLYHGSEWDFDLLRHIYDACEEIAVGELGLNTYPNQLEVITSEQMLDAYAAIGMPTMYRHWSFGKKFAREEMLYRKGAQSLAYELVINSNPCVNYIMEENTATMQTLVIAHAAFGHNHFFKNNQLFRQWTRADRVLDELSYAKKFLADCEQRYGLDAVEDLLDSAHALMQQSVDRYAPKRQSTSDKKQKAESRANYLESTFNDLYRTLPTSTDRLAKPLTATEEEAKQERNTLELPQENLLRFLARHAPKLKDWQREVLEIVRRLAQYFYPQRQTKLMNEGCATFTHYEIMNRLHDRGQIDQGAMLEFLHMHTAVVTQPSFDSKFYRGINPYALGFAMMRDIQRICNEPDEEDREWFPEIAGNGEAMQTIRQAWEEYRDESFVMQFLSPRLIRELRMFAVNNHSERPFVSISDIHDERGYRNIRQQLASEYDLSKQDPDIEVTDADLKGSRRLVLTHRVHSGRQLNKEQCKRTLRHVANLWGYRVRMLETDPETGITLDEYEAMPMP
ncbi:SpoVR family protein [Novipirellula aureliae]|uniref:SpoVR family protein n=1 Tax=Novipirellula aureliae TaxID=2527966 RepID=A0A5C6E6Z8_9BACT|nr:SpoVR family protein [Novipirellula aureliae]TWU42979.1 SpoVR family protein [Novipirellula aureliae]